jgi:hypothetical protein
MAMNHSTWCESIRFISFFASVLGLYILYNNRSIQARLKTGEFDAAQWSLFAMSFAYWIVRCVAVGVGRMVSPDWPIVLLSLKLTVAFSSLLTFACALSLPLTQMAARQQVE